MDASLFQDLYKHLYKSQHLSDLTLRLVPEEAGNESDDSSVVETVSIPIHGVLLSAASEYFKTTLARWNGGDNKVLEVKVDPTLWEAVDHMIYFLYHNKLPDGITASQVISVMQVADRFGAAVCLAACSAHLSALAPDELPWSDVLTFFLLPESLTQQQGPVAAAASAFHHLLLSKFTKLEEAWRDETTRTQFLTLPASAVQTIISSNDLEVISENTVATALQMWIHHDHASRHHHAPHLLHHIRPHHTTHSYFTHIFCQAFSSSLSIQSIAAVASYHAISTLPDKTKQRLLAAHAPKRASVPAATSKQTLTIDITTADLLHLLQQRLAPTAQPRGPKQRTSPPTYYNGFLLSLCLRTVRTTGSNPPTYMLCIGCDAALPVAPGGPAIRPPDLLLKASLTIHLASRQVKYNKICQFRLGGSHNFVKLDLGRGQGQVHDVRSLACGLAASAQLHSLPGGGEGSEAQWDSLAVELQQQQALIRLEAQVAGCC